MLQPSAVVSLQLLLGSTGSTILDMSSDWWLQLTALIEAQPKLPTEGIHLDQLRAKTTTAFQASIATIEEKLPGQENSCPEGSQCRGRGTSHPQR